MKKKSVMKKVVEKFNFYSSNIVFFSIQITPFIYPIAIFSLVAKTLFICTMLSKLLVLIESKYV